MPERVPITGTRLDSPERIVRQNGRKVFREVCPMVSELSIGLGVRGCFGAGYSIESIVLRKYADGTNVPARCA